MPAMPVSQFPTSAPTDATRGNGAWTLVFAPWLLAAAATLGALFLREVVGVAPCVLCWYPAGVHVSARTRPRCGSVSAGPDSDSPCFATRDRRLPRRAVSRSPDAWVVPHGLSPCVRDIPCYRIEVEWFDFLAIPILSLLSFTAITSALVGAHSKLRP
jgi:disulfide bond formation protein DsbB